jgi:hypothetical protein
LIELHEEEQNCCRDTTSLEHSTKVRFAEEFSPHQDRTRRISIKEHPFIRNIKEVLTHSDTTIAAPPIKFEFSTQAAIENWEIISNAGGLDNLIRTSPFSPLSYGSEFRESWRLAPLLHDHPLWTRFKSILDNGSIFPLTEPPPEDVRRQDFEEILKYKNHKSAIMMMDILNDHLSKEVERGWLIPLRPCDAKKLTNASIAPMGVVSQSTINKLGEIIPSNRVTHDPIISWTNFGIIDKFKNEDGLFRAMLLWSHIELLDTPDCSIQDRVSYTTNCPTEGRLQVGI